MISVTGRKICETRNAQLHLTYCKEVSKKVISVSNNTGGMDLTAYTCKIYVNIVKVAENQNENTGVFINATLNKQLFCKFLPENVLNCRILCDLPH